jgi:hypothetical protein
MHAVRVDNLGGEHGEVPRQRLFAVLGQKDHIPDHFRGQRLGRGAGGRGGWRCRAGRSGRTSRSHQRQAADAARQFGEGPAVLAGLGQSLIEPAQAGRRRLRTQRQRLPAPLPHQFGVVTPSAAKLAIGLLAAIDPPRRDRFQAGR